MIQPRFTHEEIETIKSQHDPLLVPIVFWKEHIESNSRIRFDDFRPTPENIQLAGFVLTEQDWFMDVINSLKNLYFERKLINRNWFITKLEPKKVMPKIDIFEGGQRQSGSFRSKS